MLETARTQYVPATNLARIYVGLGSSDHAFVWLDKAAKDHALWMVELEVEPLWDGIRSDPRFAELVRQVGLPHVKESHPARG